MSLFRSKFSQAALLVSVVLLAYVPLWQAGFVWDDDHMLTDNSLIRAADGLYQFWFTRNSADYWPVTSTTLWAEWRLWGIHPLGYHLTNLALHCASVLLLWSVLRQLRVPGAWLAALFFGVHPLNVESVTWIAERKNGLAMLFYLLSIRAWLRSSGEPRSPVVERGALWYCLSLLAFLLGMLSKGSVAMLPIVLLGIVVWRQRRLTRADCLRLLPFFAVAAGLVGVNVWFQRHGMPDAIRSAGLVDRAAASGAVIWFYFAKAWWPAGLRFVYPQWQIRSSQFPGWLPLFAVFAFTALLLVAAVRARRSGTSTWQRGSLYAWIYFCLSLVPVLGFVDVYFMKYSLVADHYAHLALIGVAAWAGFAVQAVYGRAAGAGRVGVGLAVAGCVAILAGLSWKQNRMYRDNLTLSRTLLASEPNSWMGHVLLATELAKRPGSAPEAIQHFETALRLRPDYAPAHNDLAIQLEQIPERTAEALAQFEDALRLDPKFAAAHGNLATLLAHLPGRMPEAIAHYEAALRLKPEDAEVHNNLAVALAKMPERRAEAQEQFLVALKLDPNDPDFHYDYANLLTKLPGGLRQAADQYEAALRLRPNFTSAHYNLAVVSAALQNYAEARIHFEKVLQLDPANEAARNRLAQLPDAR